MSNSVKLYVYSGKGNDQEDYQELKHEGTYYDLKTARGIPESKNYELYKKPYENLAGEFYLIIGFVDTQSTGISQLYKKKSSN